ncbi:MAG: hypothetical protein M3P26_16590 [Gemmatimonadota bacterium]|nr:hypothetical protein [Gemmatimonadota bacterium]
MLNSELDAPLDADNPYYDPYYDPYAPSAPPPEPTPIYNTLEPTAQYQDPIASDLPIDAPAPIIPPIDQGTYGPEPIPTDTSGPTLAPPTTATLDPQIEPMYVPPPPTSDPFPTSRLPAPTEPAPLSPPTTATLDPQIITTMAGPDPENPWQIQPEPPSVPPAEEPTLTPPTTGTVDPVIVPPSVPPAEEPTIHNTLPPAPPPATTAVAPPPPATTQPQQTVTDTTAEDERMRRLLEANVASKPTEVPDIAINPEDSLVGQQVSPAESARLQGREAAADEQLAIVADSDRNVAAQAHAGEAINPEVSARLAAARAAQDEQLAKVRNTPNRYNLARERFGQFERDTAPEYDLNRKKALSDAANFGYTGSGRLNTDYGNLELTRERDMDSQRGRLFNTALDQSINDDRDLLTTLERFSGNESAYDQQTRDELRREREWRVAQGDRDIDSQYRKSTTLSGAEAEQRGVEEGTRDEQRGERDYQRSLSEQALADAMDSARLQEGFTQSEFERDQARLQSGYAGDPADAYEAAARQAAEEGQISAEELAQILAFLASQRQTADAEG